MLKIVQFWLSLRSSLWFLPGVIVLMSVALALLLVEVDHSVDQSALDRWPLLFGSSVDGARGLLATVASSMMTVVGVVFSITVVALSLASSQYTSRVLSNFMRDRATQWVLGLMVGVFGYCLVVLRAIRGGPGDGFVPSLATLGGLILAFVGIAALIFFIHHISASIQAAHILAAAARDTLQAVDRHYPEIARAEQELADPAMAGQIWQQCPSAASGYLQSLDVKALVRFAAERQTVIRFQYTVGDFVVKGTPLLALHGLNVLDHHGPRGMEAFYTVGRQRTIEQDAAYGIRQIVDTALKALSPGINDSTTAVMCIERLSEILFRLGERQIPTVYRDERGEERLLLAGPTYDSFLADAFHQIRRSAAGNVSVLEALVSALRLLADRCTLSARREPLREHAEAVARTGRRTIEDSKDLEQFEARISRLLESFAQRALNEGTHE